MSAASLDQLIFFTRYPVPGRVKTRLIPALGARGAAELHRHLTEHCLDRLRGTGTELRLRVHYTGGSREQMQAWLPGRELVRQQQGDLGTRLTAALTGGRTAGFRHNIVIGSDCPALDSALVLRARESLKQHPLVLGPSMDGGFYLLGVREDLPSEHLATLLGDISWGSAEVLDQLLGAIASQGLTYHRLPPLHDIDRPEDLDHFHHHARP